MQIDYWPTATVPRSGHMSTIDQAQIKESPPAETDVLINEPRCLLTVSGWLMIVYRVQQTCQ